MPSEGDLAILRWNATTNKWVELYGITTPSINLPDGTVIAVGSTTGLQIGESGDKLGFAGATPVVRPSALTAKDAGTANSGDATTDGVIDNNRTRIEEIEGALQALGLLS